MNNRKSSDLDLSTNSYLKKDFNKRANVNILDEVTSNFENYRYKQDFLIK